MLEHLKKEASRVDKTIVAIICPIVEFSFNSRVTNEFELFIQIYLVLLLRLKF